MLKQKKRLLLWLTVLVLLIGLALALMYAFQVPFFDGSGWDALPEGGMRYLDYYGRARTGWLNIAGERYYFDPADGLMQTGWLELDEKRYYLDDAGAMHTGWLDAEDGRYYLDEKGVMQTGWLDIKNDRYYLNENGTVHTGWLDTEDGRYYMDEGGTMHTGWLDTEDGRYYMDEGGTVYTGWLDTEDGRYYLGEDGTMHTGWLGIEDDRYYLNESGAVHTGWLEWEGERYYFRDDGTMAKGRVTLDGTNYFFASTGKHVVVVNAWNPVPEDYEPELVRFDGFRVSSACVDALEQMMADCRKAGYSCKLNSAYRDVDTQQRLWNKRYNGYIADGYSKKKAEALVASSVAVPGTSEHHLGLAVDIGGSEKMYAWLAEHSWEYGFHLRYPEGKTDVTGIIYEPWHFRYLGKELAQELYELDVTVEEYMQMLTQES